MTIAKILMTLSTVSTYEGSGSFTAWGFNPITVASFSSCLFLSQLESSALTLNQNIG